MINKSLLEAEDPMVVDRSDVYPDKSKETTAQIPESKGYLAKGMKDIAISSVIIGVIVGILYINQTLNDVLSWSVDRTLSLYPRKTRSLYAIFTCTFIHDDFYHLNTLVLFFCFSAYCILLRGKLLFLCVSVVTIVFGNFLSWIIGVGCMNGISGWTSGLLLSSYFSVHDKKTLIIDIVVTVLMIVLICFGLIPSTTACFQYTISGAVMGIFVAYLFAKSPFASALGLKEQSNPIVANEVIQQSTQQTDDAPKRVTVGKHLMNFNDLRSSTVSRVYRKQR
ncbi:protease [Blastocystis sp. subtype 4]|uniref:protease n=1 Tax=Blastocystis sp. subtype 4 TaxID=944170 RepID=UPI0007118EBC|nr:protease [Blastocystis sp. subtype 4]KNB43568.1 protease [Blastocystis sp. subtype 4]|eukprot:XP_014527011.1 protease [Blastocystis sp. subtype 4]